MSPVVRCRAGGYSFFSTFTEAAQVQEGCALLLEELHRSQLLRVDRCSMAHGIEARVPFLDQDFVEYAMSINPESKLSSESGDTKYVLRQAFAGMPNPPAEILWRPKLPAQDGYGRRWKQGLVEHCSREVGVLGSVEGITHPVALYLHHQITRALGAASVHALARTTLDNVDRRYLSVISLLIEYPWWITT